MKIGTLVTTKYSEEGEIGIILKSNENVNRSCIMWLSGVNKGECRWLFDSYIYPL